MSDSVFLVTQEERDKIISIYTMVNKISQTLDTLSPEIREHIKYELEVFKNESEYLTDMLASFSL